MKIILIGENVYRLKMFLEEIILKFNIIEFQAYKLNFFIRKCFYLKLDFVLKFTFQNFLILSLITETRILKINL